MKKITMYVGAVLLWLVALSCAQATTVMTEFGRSPFFKPPLTSIGELQTMVETTQAEVRKGFALAGREDLVEQFLAQIRTAPIEMSEFYKDTTLAWMFYKKKGKGEVKICKDVVWGGEKPFQAFVVNVDYGDKIATFVIPLACGNIALLGETAKPAPPPPNRAPTCSMTVVPQKAFCGEPVIIDASASADPDGDVARMVVSVVDEQGTVVTTQEGAPGALSMQIAMPCGNNTIKVAVIDNDNESSSPAECVMAVQGIDRVRLVTDVGFFRQFDPATYLFGRVGGEYRINDAFSILGLIGVAPEVDGEDGETALLLDVLGEYSFAENYFVNFGVGGWLTDGDSDLESENSQLDVILGMGARIYGEPEAFNTSVFVEIRSGIDELDSLKEYGRFGVGLRFRF